MNPDTIPHISSSALVIIDMQNDFALPDAPAGIDGTMEVLPEVVRLADAYRQAGLPVIHIVRLYMRDGSNVDLCRRSLIQSGKEIVAPGTTGSQILDDLTAPGRWKLDHDLLLQGGVQVITQREFVIYKPRWGAFYDTPLQRHLDEMGVNTLVFCGCNFPNCPRTSIYEASERDYRIVMAEDAVSVVYPKGLEELSNIGVQLMPARRICEQVRGSIRD